MTLAWASSICCCSITCHFELGRHKSKLFSTFSTNGNVPNNTSSFYLHLLQGALKNYLIFSLTLHIIFSHCRSFLMVFTPNIEQNFNFRWTQFYCSVKTVKHTNKKDKLWMCFNLVLSKICVFFNKLDRPGPDRLDTYQHYFNPDFIYKLEAQHNCAKLIGRATKATQYVQRYLNKKLKPWPKTTTASKVTP